MSILWSLGACGWRAGEQNHLDWISFPCKNLNPPLHVVMITVCGRCFHWKLGSVPLIVAYTPAQLRRWRLPRRWRCGQSFIEDHSQYVDDSTERFASVICLSGVRGTWQRALSAGLWYAHIAGQQRRLNATLTTHATERHSHSLNYVCRWIQSNALARTRPKQSCLTQASSGRKFRRQAELT